jgi:hypothetical protein
MDEFGHLNPNMHSGDTGYYNGFPVTYTKEPGKDHTFVVSYSINGWQNADGTPFTSTFTQTTNPDRAVSQVKGFIDQRTDPSKNIQPWDLDVDKNFNLVPNSSFWASHSTEKYLGFQIITCSDDLGDRSSWGSGYGYYVPLISNGNKQEIRQMAHLGTSMQFLLFEGDMPDNKIKNEIYKTALIKPPVSSVK